jgi:4-amino-4-deoxy-L-arabinose transferase-like glycosyltransferase
MGSPATAPPVPRTSGPTIAFWRWVAAFAAAGLAIRLAHLFAFDHDTLSGDGFGYVEAARAAADGTWFSNPVTGGPSAGHPPLWTLILSVAAVFGIEDLVQFQVLASLIGVAAIVAVAVAGRRIAGARVGVIAAGVAAVYPGFWLYERIMLSETLLLVVVAVFVLVAYRFADRPSTWGAVALGFVAGIAALTRSEQILLGALVIAPLVLTRRDVSMGRRLAWTALAAVVLLVTIAPWTAYNRDRFAEPVILSTQSAMVLNIGNCEKAYYGPNTGWFDTTCAVQVAMQTRDDPGRTDAAARERAITYARDNAGRLPVVVVARIGRTFGFWAPFQQTELEWELQNTGDLLPRSGLVMYWVLIPLAVVGAVALHRRRVSLIPLVGVIAVVLVTTAVTLGESRYRAAAEVPVVLLAAVGIDVAVRRLRDRRGGRGRNERGSEPWSEPEPPPGAVDEPAPAPAG